MNPAGSVFRINLKGAGETFLWTGREPLLEAEVVQSYLPSTADDLFGPNIAFTSVRLARDRFFVATISRWYKRDEFGRRGLDLAQAEIVTFNPEDALGFLRICERFLAISQFHRSSYLSLGEMLETLANAGSALDAKRFADAAGQRPGVSIDTASADLLQRLVDHLRSEVKSSDDSLRIYLDFPAPNELGPCVLIGLQAGSSGFSKVGGGGLDGFVGIQHIVSGEEVPGFRYVDLARLLVMPPRIPESGPQPEREGASMGEGMGEGQEDRPRELPQMPPAASPRERSLLKPLYVAMVANLLLVLVSLLLSGFGLFMFKNYAEQQKKLLGSLHPAARPVKGTGSTSPRSSPTLPAPPASGELSALVKDLFAQDQAVREAAFKRLEEGWSLDARAMDNLLDEAETHTANKQGILSALQFLERRDLALLEHRRERLTRLLAEVRGNSRGTRKQADRILARLNER